MNEELRMKRRVINESVWTFSIVDELLYMYHEGFGFMCGVMTGCVRKRLPL